MCLVNAKHTYTDTDSLEKFDSFAYFPTRVSLAMESLLPKSSRNVKGSPECINHCTCGW